MKTLTAAEANRHFSVVLREVSRGETVTVVSRGKPVATIAPAGEPHRARETARQPLLRRLRARQAAGRRRWSRAQLYDDAA